MLRRRDKLQRVQFTDISSAEFSPANIGRTHDQLMAEIHGRLPDGSIITGAEVFRRVYAAVGFRWESDECGEPSENFPARRLASRDRKGSGMRARKTPPYGHGW